MINNKMDNNKKQEEIVKKPNETGGVMFSSSVKIFDPNTKEVMVQIRGER